MRVAYLNGKGGVGKTSSSLMSAEAAYRAGYSAAVIDADPQGSASSWAEAAEAAGTPLHFPVDIANRATLAKTVEKSTVDFLFIDTAPNDPAIIDAAAAAADMVIIPTGTTIADMDRAIQTYEAMTTPAAILLWRVDRRHQLYKQSREMLTDADIAVFTTAIPDRQEINRAWHTDLSGVRLHGYEEVITELSATMRALTS